MYVLLSCYDGAELNKRFPKVIKAGLLRRRLFFPRIWNNLAIDSLKIGFITFL